MTLTINVDFDGTCVSNQFPNVGREIGAAPVLKELTDKGHKIILFTMRSDIQNPTSDDKRIILKSGTFLTDAVNWFKKHDIPLYGINTNPNQYKWSNSPKSYADIIIDDTALGCPLKRDLSISQFSFVDWEKVRELLTKRGIL